MIGPNAPEGSTARLKATIKKLADGALRDSLTATLDADEALQNGDFGTFASWVKKAGDAGKAVAMAQVQRLRDQSLASAVQLASTFSR